MLSAAVTYLIAARNLSGKIKNSEASELWAESRSIREWSTARVKELNDHIDELESRIDKLEEDNRKLQREKEELKAEIARCKTLLEAYEREQGA